VTGNGHYGKESLQLKTYSQQSVVSGKDIEQAIQLNIPAASFFLLTQKVFSFLFGVLAWHELFFFLS